MLMILAICWCTLLTWDRAFCSGDCKRETNALPRCLNPDWVCNKGKKIEIFSVGLSQMMSGTTWNLEPQVFIWTLIIYQTYSVHFWELSTSYTPWETWKMTWNPMPGIPYVNIFFFLGIESQT